MNCSTGLIEGYLDGELDAAGQAAVEQHFEACPNCSAALQRGRALKADVRRSARYYGAPPELRASIQDALRQAAGPRRASLSWRRLAIAASALLAVSVTWNIVQLRRGAGTEDGLVEGVVAGHIRSLLGTNLVDVPSSDQHTVKPWFAGKLDFSPDVKDLDKDGFPLEGGRVEYLARRRVAALVYRRRQHVINLFTWPAGSRAGAETDSSRDGYHVIHWTAGAMTYWAVSDVSVAELNRFRTLYKE